MADDGRPGTEVSVEDDAYPRPLHHVFDPPPVLYVAGRADWTVALGGLAVAIVGARDATAAGLGVARGLGRGLAEHGITVVSGLALGIDAAAHAGALEAGGTTVAVVGCGTDVVYPWRNRRIRRRILEAGLVVSEWAPGTEPRPFRFPARNRIISGLSLGVVVVEATERSGALITARCALEQGREVFAVPGPAGAPRSRGPHGLLKDGACLVENVHDILVELALDRLGSSARLKERSGAGGELLRAVAAGARTVDEMAERTGQKIEQVWEHLLDLEVRGEVLRGPGGRFAVPASRPGPTRGAEPSGLDSEPRRELGAPPKAKEERWRRIS